MHENDIFERMVCARFVFLIFFLGVVCVFTPSLGQLPHSFHIDNQNALPSQAVYSLTQDNQGFIWFSGDEGLSKFDGKSTQTFTSKEQTSTSGSSTTIDRFGRVWYMNFDGFAYYFEQNKLHALDGQKKAAGYVPLGITSKHLFIAVVEGIQVFDLKTLKCIKTIPFKNELIEHSACNSRHYFFISHCYIYRIDQNLQLIQSENKLAETPVKQVYTDKYGVYVLSKFNGQEKIYCYDTRLNFRKTIPIFGPKFIQGSAFLHGQYWLFTSSGVYVYAESGKLIHHYFPAESISYVYQDRQKNHWFCTTNSGVFIVPNLGLKLKEFPGIEFTTMTKTKNELILGSQKGVLYSLDYKLNQLNTLSRSLSNSSIYYLFADQFTQNIFYSSQGFTRLELKNKSAEQQLDIAVKQLVPLSSSLYAFASSGSIGLMQRKKLPKDNLTPWEKVFTERDKHAEFKEIVPLLGGIRAKSVVFDAKNQVIYAASNAGITAFHPTHLRQLTFEKKTLFAKKLEWINDQLCVLESKGNFLVFKGNSCVFSHHNEQESKNLKISAIKGIGNQLFAWNEDKLYIFSFVKRKFIPLNINAKDYKIYDIESIKNELIILTNKGLLYFKKNVLNQSRVEGKFLLTGLQSDGKELGITGIPKLSWKNNTVSISFALLDFGTAISTPLYYRMNEGNWNLIDEKTRNLEFPSLSPGNYHIQFKVNNRIFSDSVRFEIDTPFWKTLWFYGLIVLFILFLAYTYFKQRTTALSRQINLLNEKVQLEQSLSKSMLTSIKAQMNPHFFYNALNTIQAYIFTNDTKNASNYLAKFSKLTRKILEMSESDTISLSTELEALHLYLELEKMRFQEGFRYSISCQITDIHSIEIPSMLIQPYVENAIKHGLLHKKGEKTVTIQVEQNEDQLKVKIRDNGIGRTKAQELKKIREDKHQSFSSSANEKRLDLLNRTLSKQAGVVYFDHYDDLQQATGTTVELNIPIR